MLRGQSVILRPLRRADLDEVYSCHIDIANRGPYFPLGFLSESQFQRRYDENGFWVEGEGMLLLVDEIDCIQGHIEFFKTVSYLDEMELSYQIYDAASRGKGVATEAVRVLCHYLFGCLKVNRLRLVIHPENHASRWVAQKCGFAHEGVARGAWYHQGKNHDVEIYALLRHEFEERFLQDSEIQ